MLLQQPLVEVETLVEFGDLLPQLIDRLVSTFSPLVPGADCPGTKPDGTNRGYDSGGGERERDKWAGIHGTYNSDASTVTRLQASVKIA